MFAMSYKLSLSLYALTMCVLAVVVSGFPLPH